MTLRNIKGAQSEGATGSTSPASLFTRALLAIIGRRSFAATLAIGLAVGSLLLPLTGGQVAGVAVAFGAMCISALAARNALALESQVEMLRQKLLDEASYHAFVDGAIQGFFRTTREGRYLVVNPALARIYGYDSPEQVRTELTDIGRSLYVDRDRRTQFQAQMVAHGLVRDFASLIRRRDGTIIWIVENARTVLDEHGQFLFYEGMVEDITVKRQSEEATRLALLETQEAARAKAVFLASISHELKTPLNAVIGFSDLMRQELFGPVNEPRYRTYISDIHDNGCRLLTMINDILDLSRVEGRLIDLEDDAVGIRNAVETAVDGVTGEKSSVAAIDIRVPPDFPQLRADPRRLHQILSHLLSNAVKFTPAVGRIEINASCLASGAIAISIADTGFGMEKHRIAQALEPFKQLDGSLSRRFEGVGLGLPLANALVRLHQGQLSLDSTPGTGTIVTIEFPLDRTIFEAQAAIA